MEKAKFKRILRNKPKVPALVTLAQRQERHTHIVELLASCLEYDARADLDGIQLTARDVYSYAADQVVNKGYVTVQMGLENMALAKLKENLGLPPG